MSARSSIIPAASTVSSARLQVSAYDWQALAGELDGYSCAVLPRLLSPASMSCRSGQRLEPSYGN